MSWMATACRVSCGALYIHSLLNANSHRGLLEETDGAVQEQAFHLVRNLAENEPGIEMIFRELGASAILRHITAALSAEDDDVVLQVGLVFFVSIHHHLHAPCFRQPTSSRISPTAPRHTSPISSPHRPSSLPFDVLSPSGVLRYGVPQYPPSLSLHVPARRPGAHSLMQASRGRYGRFAVAVRGFTPPSAPSVQASSESLVRRAVVPIHWTTIVT